MTLSAHVESLVQGIEEGFRQLVIHAGTKTIKKKGDWTIYLGPHWKSAILDNQLSQEVGIQLRDIAKQMMCNSLFLTFELQDSLKNVFIKHNKNTLDYFHIIFNAGDGELFIEFDDEEFLPVVAKAATLNFKKILTDDDLIFLNELKEEIDKKLTMLIMWP